MHKNRGQVISPCDFDQIRLTLLYIDEMHLENFTELLYSRAEWLYLFRFTTGLAVFTSHSPPGLYSFKHGVRTQVGLKIWLVGIG